MGKQFEFAEFVDEFKVTFTVFTESKGYYAANGDWIPGSSQQPKQMQGIILPLTRDELRFEVNGGYTVNDRKIYTTEPLQKGQKIEYKGQSYTIDSNKPYEDYADVFIYYAKGVGTS